MFVVLDLIKSGEGRNWATIAETNWSRPSGIARADAVTPLNQKSPTERLTAAYLMFVA